MFHLAAVLLAGERIAKDGFQGFGLFIPSFPCLSWRWCNVETHGCCAMVASRSLRMVHTAFRGAVTQSLEEVYCAGTNLAHTA